MKLPGKWYAGDRVFFRIPIERIQYANALGSTIRRHRFKDAEKPTMFWSRRNAQRFAEFLNEMDAKLERFERTKGKQ